MSVDMGPAPKDSSNGFSMYVTLELKPGKGDDFLKEFAALRALASAEPECVLFELFRTEESPDKFVWFETWTSTVEHFMQHQLTKPYMVEYGAKIKGIAAAPRSVRFLHRIPAQPL